MTERTCRAVGCNKTISSIEVERKVFLCTEHWQMLPVLLRRLLSLRARQGENDDYLATVFVAISLVALDENKPLPSMNTELPVAKEPLLQGVTPYPD
jgi:hypothetical protein